MRTFLTGLALSFALAACVSAAPEGAQGAVAAPASPYPAALGDERRPQADRDRDAVRHPADILAFAGVSPGQRVADVGPGGGYYTRLFAVAVGEAGRVYAIDRASTPERPRPILAVAPEYPNVVVIQRSTQGWTTPEPLDVVFLSQVYHDYHLPQANLDVPAINRDMFAALKPGGTLIVIDHAAVDGSDLSVAGALHRIDRATVVREVEAAGFVLEAESQVLRNPADTRAERVFETDIRGHTDQFVLRFRKPA
jgi:predicted methyltransferase